MDAAADTATITDDGTNIEVNGVDIVHWNGEGRIVSFKVMIRPMRALNDVVPRMAAALARVGALDGLSIGYRTARARRDGRLRVLSGVELWEVSLVTFPMLPGARFRGA